MSLFSSKTKSELEKLIEENDELKNTVHSYVQKHNSLTELEGKLTAARKELDLLNKKIQIGNDNLGKFDSEIEKRRKLVNELDHKIAQIDEVDKKYANLNEKHMDLENAFGELQEQYLTLEGTVQELHDKEENLRATKTLTESSLDDVKKKIKETEEELENVRINVKSEENTKSAKVIELDEKISLSEDIKSNLEASIAALVGQLSEKEKMFAEFIDKRDSLIEELRLRQKEFDEHDYKFNYQRDMINKLEEELKQLEDKKTNFSTDIRKFEIVKIELQDEILSLRNEEERYTESLAVKLESVNELEKKKHEIEESRFNIESNFSQVLQQFTEEVSTQKILITSLRHEIMEKEKELSDKEKTLSEKTSKVAEYGGLMKVLQKERAATEQTIKNLKEQSAEINDELSELREKTNSQKAQMQQYHSEVELIEMKKSSLELELNQIISQAGTAYNNLDENKKRVSSEISSSQVELDELKKLIVEHKNELRNLKQETANVAVQKEDYSSKISELIAMEKTLKSKISKYQKQTGETGINDFE